MSDQPNNKLQEAVKAAAKEIFVSTDDSAYYDEEIFASIILRHITPLLTVDGRTAAEWKEIADATGNELFKSAQKIAQAIAPVTPSAGHDWYDEIIGLLRVARLQRDSAERELSAAKAALPKAKELLMGLAAEKALHGSNLTVITQVSKMFPEFVTGDPAAEMEGK